MARPVTNRSASAGPRPSTARASVVLATTPATMLPSMSRGGERTPAPGHGGRSLDDALGAEPGDLLAAQAERREHLLGVLAADGRRGPHGPRCVRQLDGHAELTDLPELRMLDVHDHLAVVHLGIADHLLRVVDLAHADVGLDEELV